MKKTKPTKEPETDAEFEDALEKLRCEVIDHDVDSFSVVYHNPDGRDCQTKLEAEDYSSALFEAWSLYRK